jgi:pimeloyl-ACP methyl ester carboxylesterase
MNQFTSPARREWCVENPDGGTAIIRGLDFGGNGPLAVLSHANGLCAAPWESVAMRLTSRWHVIALDARGHGDSDPPPALDGSIWDIFVSDLIAVTSQLLEEHGQSRIDYGIGSSMGGIVTAVAEARQPGLFRRIAMLDPPIHPTPGVIEALNLDLDPGSPRNGSSLVEQTRRRRAIWPSREAARAAWRDKPMFAAMSDRAFELYVQEALADQDDGSVVLKCDPAVEAHVFETTNSLDVLDYGPKVSAPVLLVHAERGHFPLSLYESLSTVFPNCTLTRLPAGHLLPLEAPQLTAEALEEFARKHGTDEP